jgi:hypothetical protein
MSDNCLANDVVRIPWDVEAYYLHSVKGKKDRKRERFPNPRLGLFSEPLTLVDIRGRIVLWYLPGLLSGQQLVPYGFLVQ